MKATYYFMYESIRKDVVQKDDVDIFLSMKQFQVFSMFISNEFMAAQVITETLIDTLLGNGIDSIDGKEPQKGVFVCECDFGAGMILYEMNVENIDLDGMAQEAMDEEYIEW